MVVGGYMEANSFNFDPFSASDPKKKRKPIDKGTRDAVWIRYIGNKATGKCYCCRIRPIHITDFQVGHNKAHAKGGSDNISNLRPICGPCNRGMGTKSIEQYRKRFSKPKTVKNKRKRRTRKTTTNPFELPSYKAPKLPAFRF